jgi:hypothetical protein
VGVTFAVPDYLFARLTQRSAGIHLTSGSGIRNSRVAMRDIGLTSGTLELDDSYSRTPEETQLGFENRMTTRDHILLCDLMKWIAEENIDLNVAPVFFYIYEFRPVKSTDHLFGVCTV